MNFDFLRDHQGWAGENGDAKGFLAMKTVMASYVVRVYRLGKNQPHNLVGVVEEAGGKEKRRLPV